MQERAKTALHQITETGRFEFCEDWIASTHCHLLDDGSYQEGSGKPLMEYSAQVYYILRGRNNWTMNFTVTKNLKALHEVSNE